ncbi:MAG: DinB family protein [Chryseolinea sp.]
MAYKLQDHLVYNVWANTKLADIIRTIDDEKYYRELKSSFPSIALTVQHIWATQHIWLRRFHGESLAGFPFANATLSKNEALKGMTASANDIFEFGRSKSLEFLSTSYHYNSLKGDAFYEPYENSLYHVVNHGTYHRGQLVTMLREIGVDKLPSTDLITYLRTLTS